MSQLFPFYSPNERRADIGVHVAGVLMSVVGVSWLLHAGFDGADAAAVLGMSLYAAGLIGMLAFSALYNMSRAPRRKEILRRFDRAAIFLMIAGTYSPFALSKMGGVAGLALFAPIWCLALFGVGLAFAFPRRSDRLALVLYLAMGWSILIALKPLLGAVSIRIVALLLAGGIVYTLGVVIHLARRLPYHNALWHACVLAAAGCHYLAVLACFAPIEA
jgi:hemolysin III